MRWTHLCQRPSSPVRLKIQTENTRTLSFTSGGIRIKLVFDFRFNILINEEEECMNVHVCAANMQHKLRFLQRLVFVFTSPVPSDIYTMTETGSAEFPKC